jgi:hypothetical protein
MDLDPELDVRLSDGSQAITFQITPVASAVEAWAVVEPFAPRTVVVGRGAAVAARARLDRAIAVRLEAGWVPLDARPAGAPRVAPTPLPPDLALQLSRLLEALEDGGAALRAADPTGQLWAACVVFLRQARRFGLAWPRARVARARRERRLGELAEQAGDMPAAILHYRAALAAQPGIGVRRRLAVLTTRWSTETNDHAPESARISAPDGPSPPNATAASSEGTMPRLRHGPLDQARSPTHARASQEEPPMAKKPTAKVQLVCRIDRALNEQVRTQAVRVGQTLTTFIERALIHAVGARATPKAQ